MFLQSPCLHSVRLHSHTYSHTHTPLCFLLSALFCGAQSHYLPDRHDARSDNGQLREAYSVTDPILYTIWKSVACVGPEGSLKEFFFSCFFNSSWIQWQSLLTVCYICSDTWHESTETQRSWTEREQVPSWCPFVYFVDFVFKLNQYNHPFCSFVSLFKAKVWHTKCVFAFV